MTRQTEQNQSAAQQKSDGSQPSRDDRQTSGKPSRREPQPNFEVFLAAFPKRGEAHDLIAAREAWDRALERADAETIIAGAKAYRIATEGRPRRYVMSARRWLQECRWRDVRADCRQFNASPNPLVWIDCGSAEWQAWTRFRGRTPPLDSRGGWRFPTRWPPEMIAAE